MDNFESTIEQYKRELMKYAQKNGMLYAEKNYGFAQAEANVQPEATPVTAQFAKEYMSNRPMPAEYEGEEEVAETVAEEQTVTDERETRTDINTGEAPAERRYKNYDEFIADNPKNGKLRVQTYASKQVFPVQNARVTVEKQFDDELHTFSETLTDVDGVSENIVLPTQDKRLSQMPGGEIPYSTYTVHVEHPQFIPLVFYNVPIFDSIESLQPASMTPNNSRRTSAEATQEPEPKF